MSALGLHLHAAALAAALPSDQDEDPVTRLDELLRLDRQWAPPGAQPVAHRGLDLLDAARVQRLGHAEDVHLDGRVEEIAAREVAGGPNLVERLELLERLRH